MRRRTRHAAIVLSLTLAACSSERLAPAPTGVDAVTYPLTDDPYTVLQALWAPLIPPADSYAAIESETLLVTELGRFEEAGLGVELSAGQPWRVVDDLGPAWTEPVASERRSLAYIWQAADPQLIDEESPIRLEAFPKLYRPHGHLTAQVFEAHVRTARRLSERSTRPFDFALVAGDLTDGSQDNELTWALDTLNGGVIDPDSGRDDDPLEGAGNDHSDPFVADGIGVPWYAVMGNHETLYNGGFAMIDDELRQAAVGEALYDFILFENGFRDGSTVDGDVVTEGTTPADPLRIPLRRHEVLERLFDSAGEPAGHGLAESDVVEGRGYFSVHPLPERPVRLVSLDTVNSEPTVIGLGSKGWMEDEQLGWLMAELDAAEAANELVIVMSHHRPIDFSESSPVPGGEVVAVLSTSPNVVLHVVGHGHRNEAALLPDELPDPPSGYWELMLASTVDFPMHSRILELVDDGNGYLSIYATNIEHNSPVDSLAHEARRLAAAKRAFGTVTEDNDVEAFWQADVLAQNMVAHIRLPDALVEELARYTWPTTVESVTTLATLSGP
jgi:3',5'-cyclic AMP phosphodiesterase CpdA